MPFELTGARYLGVLRIRNWKNLMSSLVSEMEFQGLLGCAHICGSSLYGWGRFVEDSCKRDPLDHEGERITSFSVSTTIIMTQEVAVLEFLYRMRAN